VVALGGYVAFTAVTMYVRIVRAVDSKRFGSPGSTRILYVDFRGTKQHATLNNHRYELVGYMAVNPMSDLDREEKK